MYSAVFFGCPTTSINPSRGTSTPTCSIEVASTTSYGVASRSATFSPRSRASRRARLPTVESNAGSNATAIASRVEVMSALDTRAVSSAMCSVP